MSEKKDRLDFQIKRVFKDMKRHVPRPTLCPDEELLAGYLNGSLTEEEREKIEQHLAFCKECTNAVISLEKAKRSYSSTQESFTTAKMLKNAQSLMKSNDSISLLAKISSWFTPFKIKPVFAMAYIAVVVIILGLLMIQRHPIEAPSPARFSLIVGAHPEDLTRGVSREYGENEIERGLTLRSSEHFKIRFSLKEDAYVYLLSLDSSGNLNVQLPEPGKGSPERLKSGKEHYFPHGDKWLKLDAKTGRETIYLIISREAIEGFEDKIVELKRSGIDRINEIFPEKRIQSFSFKHE